MRVESLQIIDASRSILFIFGAIAALAPTPGATTSQPNAGLTAYIGLSKKCRAGRCNRSHEVGEKLETTIQLKKPADCSKPEIEDFYHLALTGGEVEPEGLTGRIGRAEFLAFLHQDEHLIGIGALKNQRPDYVKDAFSNAGCRELQGDIRRELGWVVVAPDHEGRGHSKTIVGALLVTAQGAPLYATSNTKRVAMHRTLARFGFKREGDAWPSQRRKGEALYLFVLQPASARRRRKTFFPPNTFDVTVPFLFCVL